MSRPSTSGGNARGPKKLGLEPLAVSLQLGARAYRALWSGIVAGTIESGVQLRPDTIAEQLDISTTPVREALHRLEVDGLIVKLPYKAGSCASSPRTKCAICARCARRSSVSACVWPASGSRPSRSRGCASTARPLAKRRCATATWMRTRIYNRDLHAAIVEAAGNAYLSSLMAQVDLQSQMLMAKTIRLAGRPSRAIEEHREIIDLIARRDERGAQEADAAAHPERERGHRAFCHFAADAGVEAVGQVMNAGGSRRARYLVVAALFLLSLITYIDRAAISSAKGPMAADLGLSDAQMGAVFSAFALGYAAAQIPCGWFADRVGPRRALALLVVLWSLLTALTGAMTRLGPLLAVRLLFGVAEAGAYPGAARVFYSWLPAGERGIANGILFSGGLLGAAFAFPVYAWLLDQYDWRGAFYVLGVPGLIWAACWMIWFRDAPREPVVHAVSAGAPEQGLWSVLRSRRMLVAMFQYFAGNFTFYICISWMHPYLIERYGLTQAEAARYAMVPLLSGAGANWIAGLMVDALYRLADAFMVAARAWRDRVPARNDRRALGLDGPHRGECHRRIRRRDPRRRADDQSELGVLSGHRRKTFGHGVGDDEHGWQPGWCREHERVSTIARPDRLIHRVASRLPRASILRRWCAG